MPTEDRPRRDGGVRRPAAGSKKVLGKGKRVKEPFWVHKMRQEGPIKENKLNIAGSKAYVVQCLVGFHLSEFLGH